MAIKPETLFSGKINPADSDYPYGSARNVTVTGDGTGTPFLADLVNDTFGFQQAILAEAGITPSQTPDTAVVSQYLEALRGLLAPFIASTAALIAGASDSLPVGAVVTTGGYASPGDGGGAKWIKTATTGVVSQAPYQLKSPKLNDAGGNQWDLVQNGTIVLPKLGVSPESSAAINTDATQGAINYLHANGGGDVIFTIGSHDLRPSNESDTWGKFAGGTRPASNACLIQRAQVTISGISMTGSILQVTGGGDTAGVYQADASNTKLFNLTIIGQTATTGGQAGVFNVVSTLDTLVEKMQNTNLIIKTFGGYGMGWNGGLLRDCLAENLFISNVGGDGLDVKSRSDDLERDKYNIFKNINVKSFGLNASLTGQSGIDLRGDVIVDGVFISNFGTGTRPFVGARFRPISEANNSAEKSNISNVYVDCGEIADTIGYQMQGLNCNSVNITVLGAATYGIAIQASSGESGTGNTITNGLALRCAGYSYFVGTDAEDNSFVGCRSINTDSATAHFRDQGIGTCFDDSCFGDSTASQYSIASSSNPTSSKGKGSARYVETLEFHEIASGRAGIKAKGPADDIDIQITPKGTGKIRVGDHEVVAAETVTGFITIKDSSGNTRKLAVIS